MNDLHDIFGRYSDAEIVAAYRVPDIRVQGVWFNRCRDQFGKGTSHYSGISDQEREDLFQESFILLWKKMETGRVFVVDGGVYATGRNGVSPVPDLMGYYMRIVKNLYFELLRDGRHILHSDIAATMPSESEIIDELYWDEDPEVEKDRIVAHCLQALPKSCLEILTMFFYERKTLEQILQLRPENTSYDGLKSRKSKCMANLKKKISESFAKSGLR